MNKREWEELKEEIAQALVASGCGYGSPVTERFAEVVRDIALPQGEHGICVAEGCRNAATTDIGFPVCVWHSELTDIGAAWDTACADAEDAWGVTIGNDWIQGVEDVIRDRIADEFRVLAAVPGRSPMAEMAYRDAVRVAMGEQTAT